MNIDFRCPACGNELSVDESMTGKRGKCPECGRLLTVPEYSSHSLVLSDKGYFKSPHLNQLFQDFLDEYDDDIKACHVANNLGKDMEGAILEIYTGRGRTQFVALGIGVVDDEEVFLSKTTIGKNPEYDGFNDILIDLALRLPIFPTYAVHIDTDSKELTLSKATRLEYVDSNVFYESVLKMARVADIVERKHYTFDRRHLLSPIELPAYFINQYWEQSLSQKGFTRAFSMLCATSSTFAATAATCPLKLKKLSFRSCKRLREMVYYQ